MTPSAGRLAATMAALLLLIGGLAGQEVGSIRGFAYDKDFDEPLAGVRVTLSATGASVETNRQGSYAISDVAPGTHTLVFTKEGYVKQVRSRILVQAGQGKDVDVHLAGEYVEMEEFVVQDTLQLSAGSEAALLELRFESAALLDSIGAELMSRAGASDAAAALKLVAGATVKDGKSAVIRGLPDRYVSSKMNGIRLPSADEDKRAVELDQFPSAVIETIQVSKTFTPDQQGDASGGAVDVRLKGIPERPLFVQWKAQTSHNTQSTGSESFLTYDGGGVSFWGSDDGRRDQQLDLLGMNWEGAAGVARGDAPIDYKWSLAAGGNHELNDDWKVGAFGSFFYEQDSSYYEDGIDDRYWLLPGDGALSPRYTQGTPSKGSFKTSLFDVTRAVDSVQWGTLGTVGLESEHHSLSLVYLFTRTTEDKVTLAEDTRGKHGFFPGHDPNDPNTPGHAEPDAAPYLRLETLDYTERETSTLQLHGHHELPFEGFEALNLEFKAPRIDWRLASSTASLNQPDKRQFGSQWFPGREPIPGFVLPAVHRRFTPAANINLGNFQRIWKKTEEESLQFATDVELPFEQWDGEEGYFKFGFFADRVDRTFDQDSFSNFGDSGAMFQGPFPTFWSAFFPDENHPILESEFDVDYEGVLDITALYAMSDLPLTPEFSLIGGFRLETTEIGVMNKPDSQAVWFPPGRIVPTTLNPGDPAADVDFEQTDFLPSIGLDYRPTDSFTFRASYNETIARQTFKELTPIQQQEFLGGPIFIGNPALQMSEVKNYDLRADYVPYQGGLLSASWFKKDLKNPIEYVQVVADFDFTTAVNYPSGTLSGWEFEIRQRLGEFSDRLEGLSLGANATLIDSEVVLPADEAANLAAIGIPLTERAMTNAPDFLYNLYATYDIESTGTKLGLFWTVQGDTLLTGAGESDGNFIPSVFAEEVGTLNFNLAQGLGEHFKLTFQAKNLTNPDIRTFYRSDAIDGDVTKTSHTRGIDLSLSLSAEFTF